MTGQRSRFTILVIRGGATRSHRIELGEGRQTLFFAGAVLVVIATFVTLGIWLGRVSRADTVASQRERIASLAAANAKIAVLSDQLAHLEADYSQVRRVMGGELAPGQRDVTLPEVMPGGGAAGSPEQTSIPSLWPLVAQGFVTRSFGDTLSAPFEGHVGLDIAVPIGSYVRASGAGLVEAADEDESYGRYVRIAHTDGLSTLYAHNSWLFVATGDSVQRGEVIALSGNTGRSTAPHLHLEVERNGEPLDPLGFVSGG